ncbi:uncharacterized protein LOC127857160 [Dreissena polymorpha]|nr:uncharacterized protein LOC127857160 [Dreissena polymorpha]
MVSQLNFSVKATFDKWADILSNWITAQYVKMGSKLKKIIVNSISIGSLIVDATLIKDDSPEALQLFTQATQDLNNAKLDLNNVQYQASLVAVGGVLFDATKPLNDQKCAIYLSARGQCANNYACVVVDGKPSCGPVKTEDDLGLVLGLGIGIPLFSIAVLVVAIIIMCAVKNRRRKFSTEYDRDSFNNGFFAHGMPVKIDTLGRNDPMYKQHSRQRDASFTNQERYVYDNQQPSNFSWDFLFNYISPNEPYHIQRPLTDRRPHSRYEGTKM